MIEINGGEKSGSGTILRLSIALASILGEELHIYNIRKKRSQPGLRPQHLEAVLTASKLCNAEVKGASVGSEEIWYKPGTIKGGELKAEIGTAGSIPMLIMTILPICAYAKQPVQLHIYKGGTDVKNSPTINYLRFLLLPTLERMGLKANLKIHKFGYYPVGMGEVSLEVQPCHELKPLRLEEFGEIEELRGISICTFLKERKVAERQAKAALLRLKEEGFNAKIDVYYDTSNPLQKGSSIVLWAKTDKNAILGADAIGELGKSSEIVGKEAAEKLIPELKAKATADVHLADMLIPYIALAKGNSTYLTRLITDHLETNIWISQKILNVEFNIKKFGNLYRIEKF
ncbi:MAG: RNA 3'-terminal phosphate cyclase [Candidatus Bathyarchaeia archaeon]